MVNATETQCLLAASVLLLANGLRISKSCLVITAASTGGLLLKARRCGGRGETSAAREIVLSRLSAAQASRLAPAKEACCLAVLEAIVGHGVVTLAAGRADAQLALHAAGELVMVDATETECLL